MHPPPMARNDEATLASLGYKQGLGLKAWTADTILTNPLPELRRQFSILEMFGLGFSIIGIVASMS